MFELNSYMIQKMGWIEYSSNRGLYHNRVISNKKKSYNLFEGDEDVRYFIEFENRNEFYVIKELSKEEKQSSKNRYKLMKNYSNWLLKMRPVTQITKDTLD